MKKILTLVLAVALSSSALFGQRLQQKTGRGVVVANRNGGRSVTSEGGSGSLISWRKLAHEPEGTTYNIYKRAKGTTEYTKVNASPVKKTNYTLSSLASNTEYAVAAIVNGVEGEKSAPFLYKTQTWDNVWFNFDFDDSVIDHKDYRTKYVWPMDLDGDGEYDAVVADRLFSGAANDDESEDSSDNTATTTHKIQAYKLDGTLLWTVDMGPNVNICAGQNDMVLAYDINCDGKCEVIIRSSDGTRFWDKAQETWGSYVGGKATGDTDGDGIIDYRTQTVYNPPFYISVIDGETGAELAWNELKYTELTEPNGDAYRRNNRSSYMNFSYGAMEGHYGIAYLDGIHPSLIMECEDRDNNKLHHGYILSWDFDWAGGQPSNWHHSHTWVRNPKSPGCAEFHQIRILDSDGDGCDEMWAGGYGVNPAQNRFISTGLAHGDRFVISDIDPDRPGLEGFAIQQSALLGQCLYDARTGERIKEWYLPSVYDVGRGTAMDVDASHKGYEIYSYADDYYYNAQGDNTGKTRSGSIYEGVWWNGDLQREELNSPGGKNWGTNMMVTTVQSKSRLIEFSQESSWNAEGGTGTRPAFMGDIMGDWREEIILVKQYNENKDATIGYSNGLVGYTTAMTTNYSIYCLQQDPHYRGDCTTRGYYQHPNTGFYLGGDMPLPPLPPTLEADLRYASGTWSDGAAGFTSFNQQSSQTYTDGKSVMFDISAANTAVSITGEVKPSATYLMNPKGKDFTLTGTIGGEGTVVKSQQGTATIDGNLSTTGLTIVSEGTLALNGSMAGALELRAKGTLAGNAVLNDTVTFEGGLNYEGCRLAPGTAAAPYGTITSNRSMVLPGNVYMEMNLKTKDGAACDLLHVNGDLTLKNTNTFTIVAAEDVPEEGEYVLAECTGTLTANASKIKVRGLVGLNYEVEVKAKQVVLKVNGMREPTTGVVWTGSVNGQWDYQTANFAIGGEATAFVTNDEVLFPEEATRRTVTLTDKMVTNGVRFSHTSGTYTLNGEGGLSGEGNLTMNGTGSLVLNATKSDYTGKSILNNGTVTVKNLENKGTASCLGAGSVIEIGKGTLVVNSTNAATDRTFTLTDTAAISVPTGATTLKSAVSGTKGVLVKKGAGQLNLNYGGTNGYAATILEAGTLAQGAWNATIGKSGSTITVTGNAALNVFNNNSTSAVPALTNAITIEKGKTLTLNTGQRCKIQGRLQGEGTVKISFPYVRGDFESNCSAFEGTLNPTSGQFRISNTLDLSKGTYQPGAGVYTANVKSQSGTEESRTNKIGALSSTASDASFGTGTWNVGYLGTNTTFAGTFNNSASLNKYGTGVLTLTGASACAISIYEGEVQAQNTSAAITSGTITVRNSGTLAGTGQVQNVTVQSGGTLGAGKPETVGTLTVNGNLTMSSGAKLHVDTRSTATRTSCDAFKVAGNVKLTSLIIEVTERSDNFSIIDDAELKVFTGTGSITITGDVTMVPATPKAGYLWDTSALATEGIIRIVADPTGIHEVSADLLTDDDIIYDVAGHRIKSVSTSGTYIVNSKKVYIKK